MAVGAGNTTRTVVLPFGFDVNNKDETPDSGARVAAIHVRRRRDAPNPGAQQSRDPTCGSRREL
jgi:hypothetical protein